MAVHTGTETVNSVLAKELAALGTQVIFGLVGEDTVELITEAGAQGIAYQGTRHENIAVGMADGYSWKSGGLGVCTVTRGPGLLNAAMALRTAARAGRSVLCITGDMATTGDWTWDFKSIEHAPLLASIGADYFPAPTAEEVVPVLRRAVAAAKSGRTVVFSVPVDVLHAPYEGEVPEQEPVATPAPEPPEPSDEQIEQAAKLLAASKKPLLLVGRGGVGEGVREVLEELAARTGALLGTSLLAREFFSGSPYDLGVVGGFTSEAVKPILGEIDCAVGFGASLNLWTTGGKTLLKGVPVVQVDIDAAKLGAYTPVDVGINADAAVAARRLLDAVEPRDEADKPFHRPEVLAQLRLPLWQTPDETTSDGLDPRVITTALDEVLPQERTIVLDSGRHLTSAGRYMRFLSPRQFRHTADGGAIGMGLGIALGAQAASPETPTVLFAGDGGMSMTIGDLESAVRNELPLIVVVMNDCAYGSELVHLEASGMPWDYATLPEIDFAATARSFGLEAATVRSLDDLREHLTNLEHRTTPLLLDVKIRQDLFIRRVTW